MCVDTRDKYFDSSLQKPQVDTRDNALHHTLRRRSSAHSRVLQSLRHRSRTIHRRKLLHSLRQHDLHARALRFGLHKRITQTVASRASSLTTFQSIGPVEARLLKTVSIMNVYCTKQSLKCPRCLPHSTSSRWRRSSTSKLAVRILRNA